MRIVGGKNFFLCLLIVYICFAWFSFSCGVEAPVKDISLTQLMAKCLVYKSLSMLRMEMEIPWTFCFFEQGIPRMSLGDVCDFQQKKIAKELKWALIEPRYSSRG
jgi:hypothetical protein